MFPREFRRSAVLLSRYVLAAVLLVSCCSGSQQPPHPTQKRPVAPIKQPTSRASSGIQQDPIAEHYKAAETFQLAQDLTGAEKEYRRVISLALQRLALVQISAGHAAEAASFLKTAVQVDPSDGDAQMALATTRLIAGDYPGAEEVAKAFATSSGQKYQAKMLLGRVYFLEGKYSEAVDELNAAMEQSPDFETAYALALAYLKLNRPADAQNAFDEITSTMGSSAELHLLIGRAYREGKQWDETIEHLKKALSLDPKLPRVHSYLGQTYLLQRGDKAFADAQQEFNYELAINPNDFQSHYFLGAIHLKQRHFAAAEQEFARALALKPESAAALLALAETQIASGKAAQAIPHLQKVIRLEAGAPDVGRAHTLLAQAQETLGNQTEAAKQSAMAKQIAAAHPGLPANDVFVLDTTGEEVRELLTPPPPKMPPVPEKYLAALKETLGNAYHNVGVIHAQHGDYAAAADLFAAASTWAPGIKSLDRNWGVASFRANQHKQAIAPLERHLRAQPSDSSAREMLALSYFMVDEFPKAAETFKPIAASLPDTPGLLYAAGVSFARSGDSLRASDMFRRMVSSNPNVPETHLFLGQAYADQKQDEQSIAEFTRALNLNPKLREAHYGIGKIYLAQGKIEAAEKEFRDELTTNPQDASAEYHLGYVLLAQQKYPEAIEVLRDVARQKPNEADAQYQLGKALLETGELKPATEHLEAAVHLEPGREPAYYQLSLAYRRQGRAQEADATLKQYEKLQRERREAKRGATSTNKKQ